MRNRELIARNIINIIDVKNCQRFPLFCNDDMFEQVSKYTLELCKGNSEAVEYVKNMMDVNKLMIDKIVQGEELPNDDYNSLMESFRVFKRKYLMKK